MLDHFDAGFVNEGQFVLSFYNRLDAYGDLEKQENLSRLVSDLLADPFFDILRRAYRVEMDVSRLLGMLSEPSYAAVVYAVFAIIAAELKKSLVGNKNPSFGMDLDVLDEMFPAAKIINVVPDGRDCALSHFKLSWGHKNAYAAARAWALYVDRARASGERIGPECYLELRYEDLQANPFDAVSRMAVFVNGSGSSSIAEGFMADLENNRLKRNTNKWESVLSRKQQRVFEAVAGRQLKEYGYKRNFKDPGNILLPMQSAYRFHDWASRNTWHVVRKLFPSISEHLKGSEHLKRKKACSQ